MICKEEMCSVFKDLRSAERIELLCSMLQLCVPLELRFVGSYLEELARKDYAKLREYEIKANDSSTLKNIKEDGPDEILDFKLTCLLNIYLSLLHSDNTTCAHVLFGILTRLERVVEDRPNMANVSSESPVPVDGCSYAAVDLTLLFTMAVHHPAFTFSQRQQLFTSCRNVERLLNSQRSSKSSSSCCLDANGSDSVGTISAVGDCCPCPPGCFISPVQSQSSSTIDSLSLAGEPYIKSIHVKNCELRASPKLHDYNLEVTWSDGLVNNVIKSYDELHSFHAELLRLFPKDSGARKQDRSLPFIPQERAPPYNVEKMTELMNQYFRKLTLQPEHIVQCEPMAAFFCRAASSSSVGASSQSNTPPSPSLVIPACSSSDSSRQNGDVELPLSNHVVAYSSQQQQQQQPATEFTGFKDMLTTCFRPPAPITSIPISSTVPDGRKPLRPWVKTHVVHGLVNGIRPLLCSTASDHNCVLVSSSISLTSIHGSVAASGHGPRHAMMFSAPRVSPSGGQYVAGHLSDPGDRSSPTGSVNNFIEAPECADGLKDTVEVHDVACMTTRDLASNGFSSFSVIPATDVRPPTPNVVPLSNGTNFLVNSDPPVADASVIAAYRSNGNGDLVPAAGNMVFVPPPGFNPDCIMLKSAVPENATATELPMPGADVVRWPCFTPVDATPVLLPPLPLHPPVANGEISPCFPDPSAASYHVNRQNFGQNFSPSARDHPPAEMLLPTMQSTVPPLGPVTPGTSGLNQQQRIARPILGASANLNPPSSSVEKNHMSPGGVPPPTPTPQWEQTQKILPLVSPVNENGVSSVPPSLPLPPRPSSNSDVYPASRQRSAMPNDGPPQTRPISGPPPPATSPALFMWGVNDAGNFPPFMSPPISAPFVQAATSAPPPVTSPSVLTPPPPMMNGSVPAGGSGPGCGPIGPNGCCACTTCQVTSALPPMGFTAYNFPHMLFPAGPAPFIPGFGYAYPSLSFPPPSLTAGSFTQPGDLVYASPPMFAIVPQSPRMISGAHPIIPPSHGGLPGGPPRGIPIQHSPMLTLPFNPAMPPPTFSGGGHAGHHHHKKHHNGGGKVMSCFNCGQPGHLANWCTEPQISSSLPLAGQFRLNCMPKVSKADDAQHRSSPRQH